MAWRIPKILCHPDGTIFADYNAAGVKDTSAHVAYFSDEDFPPSAKELGITKAGMSHPDELVWPEQTTVEALRLDQGETR